MLEKAGYFQSITVGVAPIVMVIASVVTFSVHMTLGFDLTAAQVSEPLGLGGRLEVSHIERAALLLDLDFFIYTVHPRSGRVGI